VPRDCATCARVVGLFPARIISTAAASACGGGGTDCLIGYQI